MSTKPVWILRDLSNGDGADGNPYPTYVWAYSNRREARDRYRDHQDNVAWAPLSRPERWPEALLLTFYQDVGGIAKGHYWRRQI